MEQLKICGRCKEEKPLESYPKSKYGDLGRYSICKSCKKHSDYLRRNNITNNIIVSDLEGEEWRAVVGFEECYMVSSKGRIKRKEIKRGNSVFEKLLKQPLSVYGYPRVILSFNGKKVHKNSHLVVWDSFGNESRQKEGYQVDHIDNVKTNNSISNLQLITNRLNSSKDKTNKDSKYTGVYRSKNKWRARAVINGVHKHLGMFHTEEEAYEMYKKSVKDGDN